MRKQVLVPLCPACVDGLGNSMPGISRENLGRVEFGFSGLGLFENTAFDCNSVVSPQSSTLARNNTQFRGDQPQRIAALAAKHLRHTPQRVGIQEVGIGSVRRSPTVILTTLTLSCETRYPPDATTFQGESVGGSE